MRRGFNRYQQSFPFDENGGQEASSLRVSSGNDMLASLCRIVEEHSRVLQQLISTSELFTNRSLQLNRRMQEVLQRQQQNKSDNVNQEILMCRPSNDDVMDTKSLVNILFGANKQYLYRLVLTKEPELLLYRERNFFLQLQLVDLNGTLVKNSNKIPLSLALYTSENPPKFIEKNTAGQKILKGYIEQTLHQGTCRFEKMQIREVTSHYRNGWIYIVLIPCMTPLGGTMDGDTAVEYSQIQPFVLGNVTVKAKKINKEPIT